MTASKNGIYLEWKPPAGKIKPHCLEYEVNFSGKNTDWEVGEFLTWASNFTLSLLFTLP